MSYTDSIVRLHDLTARRDANHFGSWGIYDNISEFVSANRTDDPMGDAFCVMMSLNGHRYGMTNMRIAEYFTIERDDDMMPALHACKVFASRVYGALAMADPQVAQTNGYREYLGDALVTCTHASGETYCRISLTLIANARGEWGIRVSATQ